MKGSPAGAESSATLCEGPTEESEKETEDTLEPDEEIVLGKIEWSHDINPNECGACFVDRQKVVEDTNDDEPEWVPIITCKIVERDTVEKCQEYINKWKKTENSAHESIVYKRYGHSDLKFDLLKCH